MLTPPRPKTNVSWITLAWLLWGVLVIAVSVLPMQAPSVDAFLEALQTAGTLQIQEPWVITLWQRMAAFLPLGLLGYWHLQSSGSRRPAWAALSDVLLVALGIELAQAAISARHAYVSDLLIALVAGGVGILIGRRWGMWRASDRLSMRSGPLFAAILLLNGLAAWPVIEAYRGATLQNWNCAFPWRLGGEPTGNRSWQGVVPFAALYDRALTATELAGDPPPGALLNHHAAPRPGATDPVLIDPWPGGGKEACRSLKAKRGFTLLLHARSLEAEQTGPARLITQSLDKLTRNLTLPTRRGG